MEGVRTRAACAATTTSIVALLSGVNEHLTAIHHVAAHLHCLGRTLQIGEADVCKAAGAAVLLIVRCSTA